MLRHGSQTWQLWLFGTLTAPAGFWIWHGEGKHFGLRPAAELVSRRAAIGSLAICLILLLLGFCMGG